MTLNAYDLSAGLFIRGLTNLKSQLAKAEEHVAAGGGDPSALLNARLGADGRGPDAPAHAPRDLHIYTLADQVHWAAEGARLAIAYLLGARPVPATNDATSFEALHQRIDATIAQFREVVPSDLEAGLDRTIVMEHPRGSVSASGRQFLIAFAIPHFFYHVTAAYSIFRNESVPLRMGDFLGNWPVS